MTRFNQPKRASKVYTNRNHAVSNDRDWFTGTSKDIKSPVNNHIRDKGDQIAEYGGGKEPQMSSNIVKGLFDVARNDQPGHNRELGISDGHEQVCQAGDRRRLAQSYSLIVLRPGI